MCYCPSCSRWKCSRTKYTNCPGSGKTLPNGTFIVISKHDHDPPPDVKLLKEFKHAVFEEVSKPSCKSPKTAYEEVQLR